MGDPPNNDLKKKKKKEEEDSTAKWNRNHTTYEGDHHNIWGRSQ